MGIQLREQDRRELSERGIPKEQIYSQVEIFKQGIPPVKLLRPCTVGDGIQVVESGEEEPLIALYREAAASGRAMKFVPASGAATRMFHLLFSVNRNFPDLDAAKLRRAAEQGNKNVERFLGFFRNLKKFAFYDQLKEFLEEQGFQLEELLAQENYKKILSALLEREGLNYNNLPKGLIKFHQYPDGSRNPLEEHLIEAASYTCDADGITRVHFTISIPTDFKDDEFAYIETIRQRYEEQTGVKFHLSFSNQKKSTDTIAVDLDNRPYRESDGRLHFRPGGHGALLENLNELRGDIVFIKNIDNVVPDHLKPPTYRHKMILGGCLVKLQNEAFGYLRKLVKGNTDDELLARAFKFAKEQLSIYVPGQIETASPEKQAEFLFARLNRPLRVCGTVKNLGEPGGGPFWVALNGDNPSLQIVESSQLDLSHPGQKKIWESSTHFNPVDLVCGVRDFRGQPFNLMEFRDAHSGFISQKSKNGRELKALELPGLWNGAMAYWNTVFVEVPIITFNPVKTVFDLLRPEHQPE